MDTQELRALKSLNAAKAQLDDIEDWADELDLNLSTAIEALNRENADATPIIHLADFDEVGAERRLALPCNNCEVFCTHIIDAMMDQVKRMVNLHKAPSEPIKNVIAARTITNIETIAHLLEIRWYG